jgi:DNA-binding transcriptional MerR regulator
MPRCRMLGATSLDSRVTVTYLTEASHYLTQRHVLPYLDDKPIVAVLAAMVAGERAPPILLGLKPMSRQSSALAAAPNHDGRTSPTALSESETTGGFTISDLARDFGVTLRTLRFYESRGLIAPARSGMTRIYSGRDRARLALILKGKQLGFTLVEIRAMLANEEKKGHDAGSASVGGLQLSREQVVEQLELLRAQRAEIDSAIAELEASAARFAKD